MLNAIEKRFVAEITFATTPVTYSTPEVARPYAKASQQLMVFRLRGSELIDIIKGHDV